MNKSSAYRDLIYKSYRTSNYAKVNPDDELSVAKRRESYEADFFKILSEDRSVKILDVGCGSGFLLDYLKFKGYTNIYGVDASEEQVKYCQEKGLQVIHSMVGDYLEGMSDHFDVIFMTDVIEHLYKDELVTIINMIMGALKPGGEFICRTGNASSIYGGTIRYIDYTHEQSFTETSLNQLLSALGFVDMKISDNKIPFGFKPKRMTRWLGVKLLRLIQKTVFTLEAGVDRPTLYGKLLIVAAKKPFEVE